MSSHSRFTQITETSGASASRQRTSYSALTSTLGECSLSDSVGCALGRIDVFCVFHHRYGGYSSAGWGHGVRNIVFRSPDPKVGPETWIRMEDGETHARIIMDQSYN